MYRPILRDMPADLLTLNRHARSILILTKWQYQNDRDPLDMPAPPDPRMAELIASTRARLLVAGDRIIVTDDSFPIYRWTATVVREHDADLMLHIRLDVPYCGQRDILIPRRAVTRQENAR